MEWLAYVVTGVVAGFLAGLLGIGGGIVVVPSLFFVFTYFHVVDDHLMHVVIATSLASMIFSSLSSMLAHHRKKAIHWVMVQKMLLGVVVGSCLGAFIAEQISNDTLTFVFGGFLLLISLKLLLPSRKPPESTHFTPPALPYTSLMGFGISSISAFLGIGGGLFTVPLLASCKMRFKTAVATSSAISFFITLFGSSVYFLLGSSHTKEIAWGLVYLPAFAVIGIVSFLAAPWGAKVAHRSDVRVTQRVFAAVLFVVGTYMIIGNIL